jgi:hypothetical protein
MFKLTLPAFSFDLLNPVREELLGRQNGTVTAYGTALCRQQMPPIRP